MVSVKEFAAENRVSESIVYRHIRNHKTALGEMVRREHGRTWLTDQGAAYIKSLMTQQTIVEEKASDVTKSMQRQLDEQRVTIEAQANIIELMKLKFEQYEADKKLLVERKEKIDALEAQKADLSAERDKERERADKSEKEAQEANMALETLVNGSWRERRKLRKELKQKKE